ncbi:hypothetical protein FHL15_001500 [Xylaria flabelliformis]|uniref:Uncharacterized protein n=1 Tax=Xylaria flabelliformis TaxID=2512241 RepID=A0A553IC09_9PEZI|nr:hypothetical protein FHL15_001500 [Xylaria flabelliformis]
MTDASYTYKAVPVLSAVYLRLRTAASTVKKRCIAFWNRVSFETHAIADASAKVAWHGMARTPALAAANAFRSKQLHRFACASTPLAKRSHAKAGEIYTQSTGDGAIALQQLRNNIQSLPGSVDA